MQKKTQRFSLFPGICQDFLQDSHRKVSYIPYPAHPSLYILHNSHPAAPQYSENPLHKNKIPAEFPAALLREVLLEVYPSPPSPEAYLRRLLRDSPGSCILHILFPVQGAVCLPFPVLSPDLCCILLPAFLPPAHLIWIPWHCTFLCPCPPDYVPHRSGKYTFRKSLLRKSVSGIHWDQIHNCNHRSHCPSRLPDPGTVQKGRPATSVQLPEVFPCHICQPPSTIHTQHY